MDEFYFATTPLSTAAFAATLNSQYIRAANNYANDGLMHDYEAAPQSALIEFSPAMLMR